MKHTKQILRPIAKEFQTTRCCFEHELPDNFVKSQWQNRSKSWIYLIYRCILAIFFIGVVIQSMLDNYYINYYFIYLTNWGILMCMIANSLGAVLVCLWHFHPEYADNVKDSNSMPRAFKVYWAMHIITLILSIIITIVYWTFLFNTETVMTITNILTHALNSIIMFIDLLIVAYPVRLLHVFYPVAFGISYALFSAIYYYCGGKDPKGNVFIYNILDWRKPESSIITVIGTLVLCFTIYMFIFIVYKIRTLIYKRYKTKTIFLPTSHQANSLSNTTPPIVQYPSNRISMALGDYGIENKAFTRSQEKF